LVRSRAGKRRQHVLHRPADGSRRAQKCNIRLAQPIRQRTVARSVNSHRAPSPDRAASVHWRLTVARRCKSGRTLRGARRRDRSHSNRRLTRKNAVMPYCRCGNEFPSRGESAGCFDCRLEAARRVAAEDSRRAHMIATIQPQIGLHLFGSDSRAHKEALLDGSGETPPMENRRAADRAGRRPRDNQAKSTNFLLPGSSRPTRGRRQKRAILREIPRLRQSNRQ